MGGQRMEPLRAERR